MIKPGQVKQCVCLIEKSIQSSLPVKYRQARLIDFSRATTELITKWLAAPTEGLFIVGPTGSGKTHLAAAIVRALYETGKKASFRRASEMYLQIRHSYNGTELSETALLAGYCGTPMLVLDDVAAGSLSDHERRIALEVIDRRGNNERPTVVTSNLSIEEIREKMDERISSRLSAYQVVAFRTADRRKK